MATDEKKIHELLEASQRRRLEAAVEAGRTAETLTSLQQQLAATEAAYTKRWKAAVEAGWTEKELRAIGLTKPTQERSRRGPSGTEPNRDPDTTS